MAKTNKNLSVIEQTRSKDLLSIGSHTACIEKDVKIGNFSFTRVILGSQDEFLYNLKSPTKLKCSGCNHYISSTKHCCRFEDLFKPNQWIHTKDTVYYSIRKENFKNILKIMLDSGLLVLSDRVKSHLMKNIFTFSPVEESHYLKPGDKIILPPIACKNTCYM